MAPSKHLIQTDSIPTVPRVELAPEDLDLLDMYSDFYRSSESPSLSSSTELCATASEPTDTPVKIHTDSEYCFACGNMFYHATGCTMIEFEAKPVDSPLPPAVEMFEPNSADWCGGDLIIIDEAAYINENLFHETILPLLGMDKAALVALSTPLTEANFFSKMIVHRDATGDLFFKTLHIGLICAECGKNPDLLKQMQCTHKNHALPQWKAGWRQERLKEISMVFDNAGRGIRENMGGIRDDTGKVFFPPDVEEVFSRDPEIAKKYTVSFDPTLIIVAVDPNAGGVSETAIMSGYFVYEQQNATLFTGVILGMDAERTLDPVRQEQLVVVHIKTLQERFPRKKIVVVPENQTGFFHENVKEWVSGMKDVQVLYQGGKEKAGVCKNAVITREYVRCVQEAFAQKAIKFDRNWFTNTIPLTINVNKTQTTDYYLNVMKDTLKGELLRFGYDENQKLTGKVKNTSFSDDRAVSFMMFLYWGRTILTNVPDNPYLNLIPPEAKGLLTMQAPRNSGRSYNS